MKYDSTQAYAFNLIRIDTLPKKISTQDLNMLSNISKIEWHGISAHKINGTHYRGHIPSPTPAEFATLGYRKGIFHVINENGTSSATTFNIKYLPVNCDTFYIGLTNENESVIEDGINYIVVPETGCDHNQLHKICKD